MGCCGSKEDHEDVKYLLPPRDEAVFLIFYLLLGWYP